MKCGLARIASSAGARPARSPLRPRRIVERHQAVDLGGVSGPAIRLGAEARDDLPRARRSSPDEVGRQLKIFCRLGVFEMPGGLDRPADDQRLACARQRGDAAAAGSAAGVRPLVRLDQILVGTVDRRTNAADTLCWPALTKIGSVRCGVAPRPSAPSAGSFSYSSSATRWPSIEMSTSRSACCRRELNITSNWYSPSAGNT